MTLSEQVGMGAHTPASHSALRQSLARVQCAVSPQALQVPPPQSVSVSAPLIF